MFENPLLLYFAALLAGFALLRVSVGGTFLAGLAGVFHVIGLLAVIVFALVIIIKGLIVLFRSF